MQKMQNMQEYPQKCNAYVVQNYYPKVQNCAIARVCGLYPGYDTIFGELTLYYHVNNSDFYYNNYVFKNLYDV